MSNNSEVLDFLEEVQETVNINNVRNALEAVSNAVSELTANVHLGASIFTDISLSVISLLNVFDYVDKYNDAKSIGDESMQRAAFGQITTQFMGTSRNRFSLFKPVSRGSLNLTRYCQTSQNT